MEPGQFEIVFKKLKEKCITLKKMEKQIPWNLEYELQECFWIWLKATDPEIKKSSGNVWFRRWSNEDIREISSAVNMQRLGICNEMNTSMNNNMGSRDSVSFSSTKDEETLSLLHIAEVK